MNQKEAFVRGLLVLLGLLVILKMTGCSQPAQKTVMPWDEKDPFVELQRMTKPEMVHLFFEDDITENLNDPYSYEFSKASWALINEDSTMAVVIVQFRSRNGFGGLVPGEALFDYYLKANSYTIRSVSNTLTYKLP